MTTKEELELLLQIMQKHDLPMSPILEYAVKEKLENAFSSPNVFCKTIIPHAATNEEKCVKDSSFYKKCFATLSTGIHDGKKLPHKAVLLLSIMTLIGDGTIKENKIGLSKLIVSTFANTWYTYNLGTKVPSVWTPFWYMKSESFWHFKALKDENVLHNLMNFAGHPTVGQMRGVIDFAYLDEQLFALMKNKSERNTMSKVLIDSYLNYD